MLKETDTQKEKRIKKSRETKVIKKLRSIQSQQGNIMLGAIFLIAIISVITLSYYKHQAWENKQNAAKSLGSEFAMVINALENRLSFDEHFGAGQYDLKALLPTSCGGSAPSDYLPCGFNLHSPVLQGNFLIDVSQSATNPEVRTANVTLGTIGLKENNTVTAVPYLAGAVVGAAKAKEAFSGNKYLSAVVSYDLNKTTAVVSAKVVANQNNSNVYLKVDGSNNMENALSFNKNLNASNRMIKYVSELTNDQALTIDAPSINLNGSTTNVNTTTTNINRNSGTVYLGNQSAIQGNSNVIVNDLTIASMGNEKLTDALKNKMTALSDFQVNTGSLNFSIKTGQTGHVLIFAYGGRRSTYGNYSNYYLTLYRNGSQLRQVYLTGIEYEDRRSSVSPMFIYPFMGAANTSYSGFNVSITGNGTPTYVGWASIPY